MSTRTPHLGHTALLLALFVLALVLTEAAFVAVTPGTLSHSLHNNRLQIAVQIAGYLVALAAAWFLFPLFWRTRFLAGIRWNAQAASLWLLPAGLALGFLSQVAESHLPIPRSLPMDALFQDRSLIPLLVVLAVLLAPLTEEIVFRGFLLPALANAFDFLRLPRFELPADATRTHELFHTSAASRPALVVSSLITSLLFALIHAPQLGEAWPAVALLASVSLVLCYVRIRFRSVAASTLVHASYNLSVFLTLAVLTGGFRHLDRLR